MDDNNDATTQQAAVGEDFLSPTEKRQGTTKPNSTSYLIGAGLCDAITFLKKEIFACILSCLFFCACCIFVCAVYRVFSPFCPQIAEAGTKGDMSYLDTPDA